MGDPVKDGWIFKTFGVNPAALGSAGAAPAALGTGAAADPLDAKLNRLRAVQTRMQTQGVGAKALQIKIDDLAFALDAARHQGDQATREKALAHFARLLDEALDGANDDAALQAKFLGQGAPKAIKDLRDAAAKQIDALREDDPDDHDPLAARLAALDKQIAAAARLTDPAEHKAALAKLDDAARKLFQDAVDLTGDEAAVQKVFKQALADKYGFEITNPTGTPNTHFDEIYAMFERVPPEDVVQSNLQKLTYVTKKQFGHYGKASISIGEFGDDPGYDDYRDVVAGTTVHPNALGVTALHELGHSLDHRWGIMAAHMARSGCGGWQTETPASVAKAIVADFLAGPGKGIGIATQILETFVCDAIESGKVERSDLVDNDDDWTLLEDLLDDSLKLRHRKQPWKHPRNYGGRTYHESYDGKWVSADWGARNNPALTVRTYQWRAPGDFFAELYAFSWYHKKPVANAVDAAIRQYLYTEG